MKHCWNERLIAHINSCIWLNQAAHACVRQDFCSAAWFLPLLLPPLLHCAIRLAPCSLKPHPSRCWWLICLAVQILWLDDFHLQNGGRKLISIFSLSLSMLVWCISCSACKVYVCPLKLSNLKHQLNALVEGKYHPIRLLAWSSPFNLINH